MFPRAALFTSLLLAGASHGATLVVDTLTDENDGYNVGGKSLREAIDAANADSIADTIEIQVSGTIALGSSLPAITSDVTVRGPSSGTITIDGASTFRVFTILSGTVTLRDLTVQNGAATGGAGGSGGVSGSGGGAAGMGGAVFINSSANVTLRNVTLNNNTATGGAGGAGSGSARGGGGGGGTGAAGSNGTSGSPNFPGGAGGGGGALLGTGGAGANSGNSFTAQPGSGDGAGGGGGAIQSSGTVPGTVGGAGAFGGGGGGGGAGTDSGAGGAGGFGGGGGAGGWQLASMGIIGAGGTGGTHAGDGAAGTPISGSSGSGGGGGAGLGGAIFVRGGATLSILGADTTSNTATGGAGGSGHNSGSAGQGKGGFIYVQSGATATATDISFTTNTAGNAGSSATDNANVFGTLTIYPTVLSVTRVGSATSNATSIQFTVTFSESVTGVGTADFAVSTTGAISSASVTGVSGSGGTYTVTVDTGSGDGTIRLDVVDDDTIVNADTVPLGLSGTGNGAFAAGESVTIDKSAPLGTITASRTSPSNATSVNFTIEFDGAVTGLDASDVTIADSGTTHGAVTFNAESATRYVVGVANVGGDGVLSISVASGAGADSIGNTTAALGPTGVTFDHTSPSVVSIIPTVTEIAGLSTAVFRVTWSEAVSTISTGSVIVTHTGTAHTAASVATVSSTVQDVTLEGLSGDGSFTLSLGAGAAADLAGNASFASSASAAVTRTTPVVVQPVSDAQLNISVVAQDGTVAVGANAVFTVVVSNGGNGDAVGVILRFPLPPNMTFVSASLDSGETSQDASLIVEVVDGVIVVHLGTVSAGGSKTLTLVLRATAQGEITLTGTAEADGLDAIEAEVTDATIDVTLTGDPDVDGVINSGACGGCGAAGAMPLLTGIVLGGWRRRRRA